MLRNWIKNLVNRKSVKSNLNGRSPARFRPSLEGLEVREVPAAIHWISPVNGDFATAANWSTGTVPGPNDDAIISLANSNVTVTHRTGAVTVRSLTNSEAFEVRGGTFTLTGASNVTGSLGLYAGTLRTQAGLSAARMTISSAMTTTPLLDGAGTVTVSGLLTYSGGRIAGTGSLQANGGVRFDGAAKVIARNFNNPGTAEWIAGAITVADTPGNVVRFSNSGSFVVKGSNLALNAYNAASSVRLKFVNSATITKTANTLMTTITGLNNSGSAVIEDSLAGNNQKLRVSGTGTGTFRVGANATLSITGTYDLSQGGSVTGAGKVQVESIGTPAGSNLILRNSSVAAVGGVTVFGGGSLSGAGTISSNLVNHGNVDPGFYLGGGLATPGTITVGGTYTQAATAHLYLAVTPTGHDRLVVTGQATLGGTFAVEGLGFINTRPAVGATYGLLSYGSRIGNFTQLTTVTLPGIPNPYLPVRYIKVQGPNTHGPTGITYEVTDTF